MSGAVLYATADGGSSWVEQTLPDASTGVYYALTFGDDLHGWALGGGAAGPGMVGTADGGSAWNEETIPAGIVLNALTAAGASDVWAVGNDLSEDGVVIASTNGGTTWAPQSLPAGVGPLGEVDFINAIDGWAVGQNSSLSGGVIVATTNGGASWTQQTDVPSSSSILGVSFATTSVGWAIGTGAGETPLLLQTTDGGATWTAQPAPAFLAQLGTVDAVTKSELVMLGYGPGGTPLIARSTDAGAKWTSATIFDPAWITVSPPSGAPGPITVSGQGFASGEPVTVRWSSATGTVLATVTAGSSGSFSTTAAVPSVAAGSYKVYAIGALSLSAPFATFAVT